MHKKRQLWRTNLRRAHRFVGAVDKALVGQSEMHPLLTHELQGICFDFRLDNYAFKDRYLLVAFEFQSMK